MTRLRKINKFNYILPLLVVVLLFSVVVSVFSLEYSGYIGKISCSGPWGMNSNATLEMELYSDPQLSVSIGPVQIFAGGDPAGTYYGFPTGLVATVFSAQAQRTNVRIVTEDFGNGPQVISISQLDQPDNIIAMFGGMNLSRVNTETEEPIFRAASQSATLDQVYTNQSAGINSGVNYIEAKVDDHLLTYFTPINNELVGINSNLTSISAELSTQTSTLSGFNTTLDSIIGRTNTLYSTTLPAINTTISTMDSYLVTNANSINATLTQHDTLIQNIYNRTVGNGTI